MWTNKNRARYDRSKLRYPSDLTDEEWGLVEPLIPPGKTGGGKRTVIMREVVNGLMYILSTGCQWRAIPKDLPPKSSVHDYFDLWTYDGTLERIHDALYQQCRERAQRQANPTAAIIDSQSVKSAEKGGRALIRTGTVGLLLHAIVHPADIQDRDGGVLVMTTLFGMFPFLKKLFVDSGYKGPKFANALAKVRPLIEIEIVKRSDQVSSFVVLPKRWIVERTIAWLNRCRRLAKDWECLNRKALAFLRLASIRLMLRKLCNPA
jgi:transposase